MKIIWGVFFNTQHIERNERLNFGLGLFHLNVHSLKIGLGCSFVKLCVVGWVSFI